MFGIVATLLAWRIVVVNLTQHLADAGSPAAASWGVDSSQVLLAEAGMLAATDKDLARRAAEQAVFYNPANGRAFLLLAGLWEVEGNLGLAKTAAKTAHFLAPRDAEVQMPLGAFWLRRGMPVQALSHWSLALESKPGLAKTLFPVMLQIADMPQNRIAVAESLSSAPAWWAQFFNYALSNTTQDETLKALYHARGVQVDHEQRRLYIDHLLAAGYSTDAYFVWLNGLASSQIGALGNVYDGGFEQALDDEGFGWRPLSNQAFMLGTEPTYGHGGEKALHIAFQQRMGSGVLIRQYLMLDPGNYRLQGRSRLDNLSAGKGLRWEISCADKTNQGMLLNTEHFTGSDDWSRFENVFKVPDSNCELQLLRLQLNAGNDYTESEFGGSAWFDDLEIVKLD